MFSQYGTMVALSGCLWSVGCARSGGSTVGVDATPAPTAAIETPDARGASVPPLVESGVPTPDAAAAAHDAGAGPRYGCARCGLDEYCLRRSYTVHPLGQPDGVTFQCVALPSACRAKPACACAYEEGGFDPRCRVVGGQVQRTSRTLNP
jgi:hypothetical protein